jgi:hypothetical protein
MKRTETDAPETTPIQEATSQPGNNAPRADLLLRETALSTDTGTAENEPSPVDTRALEEEEEEEEEEQTQVQDNYDLEMVLAELDLPLDLLHNDPLDGLVTATISYGNPDSSPDTKEGEDLTLADQLMTSANKLLAQQDNSHAEDFFKQALQKYKNHAAKTNHFSPKMEKCLEQLMLICFQQNRLPEANEYLAEMEAVKVQKETILNTPTAGEIDLTDLPSSDTTTAQPNSFSLFSPASSVSASTSQPTSSEEDTLAKGNSPS